MKKNQNSGYDHIDFQRIYYEHGINAYPLGKYLLDKYKSIPQNEIDNHNNIEELRKKENKEFARMKNYLIIGTRKTHKYVENHKVSDFLVPFSSSGCAAMCLYCYLVCNYNKCSYLRVFVNIDEMLTKLIKRSRKYEEPQTFEIGSNSDLILENTVTNNLPHVIETFAKEGKGFLTFPTKFDMVDPLLNLNHKGKIIFRMSVNPEDIINNVELRTAPLLSRIEALNKMYHAGYKVGLLIAPVILFPNYKELYGGLIKTLEDKLDPEMVKGLRIEIIFMTYSFVHRAINSEAFPALPSLYNEDTMRGRGYGKYCYKKEPREEGEKFLVDEIHKHLKEAEIFYIC